MMIALPNSSWSSFDQLEDLRLRRHVERRRRLVGDQQVGVVDQRHRDHHALAHAARELVRVVVDAPLGARDADRLQQLERARARRRFVTSWCSRTASTSCLPIRVHRVQRRHRVLEDHRDVVAADLAQPARAGIVSRSSPLKSASPVVIVFCVGVQAHDRQAGHALARAGLADDAERLALLDREADAVDGLDDAVVGAEVRPQVLDLEQRHLGEPDPRVDDRVEQVDEQVDDDDRRASRRRRCPASSGRSKSSRLWSSVCPRPGRP